MADPAATVMERGEILGKVSEDPDLLVRPYGSEALRRANALVAGWMCATGVTVGHDEIGNPRQSLRARKEGGGIAGSGDP